VNNPVSLSNLRPYQPGQPSSNPGGKPKQKPLADALRRQCEMTPVEYSKHLPATIYESLAHSAIESALGGRIQAFTEICDRIEGKVTLEVAAGGGSTFVTAERLAEILFKVAERKKARLAAMRAQVPTDETGKAN
jgi:hypothetical protein